MGPTGLQLPSPALVGLALLRPVWAGAGAGRVTRALATLPLQDRELGPEELDGE